jgi:two-component system chemotaxis response regulator CheB
VPLLPPCCHMTPNKKIRVLVVDDSSIVRKMIISALSTDPQIDVVGEACDPFDARNKILELDPDVLTLDIEMPRMDGLTFLRIIQKHRPIPVIIISALAQSGSWIALDALEAGAFDVLAKPANSESIGDLGTDLPWRVKGAAMATRRATSAASNRKPRVPAVTGFKYHPEQILLIGGSTGGIEALYQVLPNLPTDLPPICITQHLPAHVSKAIAKRLNDFCGFEVREAADGDELRCGLALIAPGDFHMTLVWKNGRHRARLVQTPRVNYCRPSVDVMFHSAVKSAGMRSVAVLLSGMGSDGARGMKALRQAGACTLVQDEKSCVVYGMPRVAKELDAVDQTLPLEELPNAIITALQTAADKPGTQ